MNVEKKFLSVEKKCSFFSSEFNYKNHCHFFIHTRILQSLYSSIFGHFILLYSEIQSTRNSSLNVFGSSVEITHFCYKKSFSKYYVEITHKIIVKNKVEIVNYRDIILM